jgi:putative endonuclease
MECAWVYMLRCADGSLYTGWCTDLERRVAQHGAGHASKYTASRRPLQLVFAEGVEGRSAALREEARIKKLSRREKLVLMAAQDRPARLKTPIDTGSSAPLRHD